MKMKTVRQAVLDSSTPQYEVFLKAITDSGSIVRVEKAALSVSKVEWMDDGTVEPPETMDPIEISFPGSMTPSEIEGAKTIVMAMVSKYTGQEVDSVFTVEREDVTTFIPMRDYSRIYHAATASLTRWCNLGKLRGYTFLTGDKLVMHAITTSAPEVETSLRVGDDVVEVDGSYLISTNKSTYVPYIQNRILSMKERGYFALPRTPSDERAVLFPEIAAMFQLETTSKKELPMVFRSKDELETLPEVWFEQCAESIMSNSLPRYLTVPGLTEVPREDQQIKRQYIAIIAYKNLTDDYPTLRECIDGVSVLPDLSIEVSLSTREQVKEYVSHFNTVKNSVRLSILPVKDEEKALEVRAYLQVVYDATSLVLTLNSGLYVVTDIPDLQSKDIDMEKYGMVTQDLVNSLDGISRNGLIGLQSHNTLNGLVVSDHTPVVPPDGRITVLESLFEDDYLTELQREKLGTVWNVMVTLSYDDYFGESTGSVHLFNIATDVSEGDLLEIVSNAWRSGSFLSKWSRELIVHKGNISRWPIHVPYILKVASLSIENGRKALSFLRTLKN